jgi:hypothetical protein
MYTRNFEQIDCSRAPINRAANDLVTVPQNLSRTRWSGTSLGEEIIRRKFFGNAAAALEDITCLMYV